jgi:hypothetical protein
MEPTRDERTSEGLSVRGLFDRAVAYWNAGRWFEAHEDWETLWNDAEGDRRRWLQGLIQFAAGFHHFANTGSASGFAKLMRTAAEKAGGYVGDASGLDFDALWAELRPWVEHGQRVERGGALRPGPRPAPPAIRYLPGRQPEPLPLEPEEPDGRP